MVDMLRRRFSSTTVQQWVMIHGQCSNSIEFLISVPGFEGYKLFWKFHLMDELIELLGYSPQLVPLWLVRRLHPSINKMDIGMQIQFILNSLLYFLWWLIFTFHPLKSISHLQHCFTKWRSSPLESWIFEILMLRQIATSILLHQFFIASPT